MTPDDDSDIIATVWVPRWVERGAPWVTVEYLREGARGAHRYRTDRVPSLRAVLDSHEWDTFPMVSDNWESNWEWVGTLRASNILTLDCYDIRDAVATWCGSYHVTGSYFDRWDTVNLNPES